LTSTIPSHFSNRELTKLKSAIWTKNVFSVPLRKISLLKECPNLKLRICSLVFSPKNANGLMFTTIILAMVGVGDLGITADITAEAVFRALLKERFILI